MSLLRSISVCSVVDAPRKNLSRPQRQCDVKRPAILVKGKLSEKEPAKTNFDAWRAAQLEPPNKVPTSRLSVLVEALPSAPLTLNASEP
jgi:hypothetical protein